jgi:hypothetical protein
MKLDQANKLRGRVLPTGVLVDYPGRFERFGLLAGDLIESRNGLPYQGSPAPQPRDVLCIDRCGEKLTLVITDDSANEGKTQSASLDALRARLLIEAAERSEQLDGIGKMIAAAFDHGELTEKDFSSLYRLIDSRRAELRRAERQPQLPLRGGADKPPSPDTAVAEAARIERLDREKFYKFLEDNEARGHGHTFEYEPCADHRVADSNSALPDSSVGAPPPMTHNWYGK